MACNHKTMDDFSAVTSGKRHWRCSKCGTSEQWRRGWAYVGTVKCRRCDLMDLKRVLCPLCDHERLEEERVEFEAKQAKIAREQEDFKEEECKSKS